MATPILSLKGVNKSFGPIDVLHDISSLLARTQYLLPE